MWLRQYSSGYSSGKPTSVPRRLPLSISDHQPGKYFEGERQFICQTKEVSTDHLDELTGYDMVFVNGMGLRIVEEQRQQIQRAADKGIPVYTSMATNPANNICNLDSVQMSQIRQYLTNAGKVNYRNLLSYVRKEIDGKLISAPYRKHR